MTQKGKITVFKQKNANEAEALQKQLQGKQKQHVHTDSHLASLEMNLLTC